MRAPYGQTPDPNHNARLLLALLPQEVQKSASPDEMNARLTEARRLGEQASDIRLDPLLRSQARMQAQRVLTAPAGDALVRKAMERGQMGQLADEAAARALAKGRAKAGPSVLVYGPGRRVLGSVPRTAIVRKASGEKAPMQAVFDQDGNLIGVVPASAIQPVAGHGRATAQAPQDQAQPQAPVAAPAPGQAPAQAPVAKSDAALVAQALKSLGPKWVAVFQGGAAPAGIVKKKHIGAPRRGRVAKASAASVANVRDSRGRLLGQAPMSAITSLAELRAARARGGAGR